jgi:hypothetical protein
MSSPAVSRLSWRIPTTGDPRILKLALAQVGLATIVAALVLLVAAPREWLGPGLAGLVPLAILVAYRRWHRFQRSLVGPENVWIDELGIHWINSEEQEQSFARGDIVGFRLGHEADTLRTIPALTVYLAGGLESQPLELYPPATPQAVREFLVVAWGLAERSDDEPAHGKRYDFSVNIYRECYEETQEWHWEGTRQELMEFFALVRRAAAELPLPPPGAKPAQWIVHMQRREPSRLRLAHAAAPQMDHDVIAAPAVILGQIADKAAELLDTAKESSDAKFDLPLGLRNVWTFHLHVLGS